MAYSQVASITISDALVGSSNSTNFPTLFRSPVGIVHTAATAVTLDSGDNFQSWMTSIMVNGVVYTFTYLTATTGTLGSSAGTQTGVAYCGTPQLATVANGGYVQNTASLTVGARTYTVPTDLVFSSDNLAASLYSWEIETWNSATGAIIAWIKIPTLSHTANTVYYVSVGNASVTTFQGGARGAAWNANYLAVWHFADGSTLYSVDSTSNANDGTLNSSPSAGAGQIDGAAVFAGGIGSSQSMSHAGIYPNNVSVECWANPLSSSEGSYSSLWDQEYVFPRGSPYNSYSISSNFGGGNNWTFLFSTNTNVQEINSGVSFTPGVWSFLVATYDGTTANLYLNASNIGTKTASPGGNLAYGSGSPQFWVANNPNNENTQGSVDELRISSVGLSADWITADYNNQKTPFTFYTMSAFAPPSSPDVTVNATGSSATFTAGSVTESGTAVVSAAGSSLTSTAGSTTEHGSAVVSAAGSSVTSTAGTVTEHGSAVVASAGSSLTSTTGSVTEHGAANVSAVGSSIAATVGTVTVVPQCIVSATGNSLTSAAGTVTETGTANVAATGSALTGSAGNSSETGNDNTSATGISLTLSEGMVSLGLGVGVSATGQQITSTAGTVTDTGTAVVTASGNALTSTEGSVSVSTGGNVTVSASGNALTSSVGSVTITGSAIVAATGNSLAIAVGSVSVGAGAIVAATGNSLAGSLGNVSVTGSAAIAAGGNSLAGVAGNVSLTGTAHVTATGSALTIICGTVNTGGFHASMRAFAIAFPVVLSSASATMMMDAEASVTPAISAGGFQL